jgi:hypothetical protein
MKLKRGFTVGDGISADRVQPKRAILTLGYALALRSALIDRYEVNLRTCATLS